MVRIYDRSRLTLANVNTLAEILLDRDPVMFLGLGVSSQARDSFTLSEAEGRSRRNGWDHQRLRSQSSIIQTLDTSFGIEPREEKHDVQLSDGSNFKGGVLGEDEVISSNVPEVVAAVHISRNGAFHTLAKSEVSAFPEVGSLFPRGFEPMSASFFMILPTSLKSTS